MKAYCKLSCRSPFLSVPGVLITHVVELDDVLQEHSASVASDVF